MITEEQILANWEIFIKLISQHIPGKRGEKLVKFYEEHSDRFATMPASGNTKFHNAFPGGYIDHVLNVYHNATALYKVWADQGAFMNDFKFEELMFATLNHDLGKFGTEEGDYYVNQTSDWHRNRGEVYTHNAEISYMKTSDRSLYILQNLGVELSENEYLAIKLHDGLYEESNKGYYVSYSDSYRLRSHLSYILHQADLMASRIEYDNVNRPAIKSITTSTVKLEQAEKASVGSTFTAKPKAVPVKRKMSGKYAHLLNK